MAATILIIANGERAMRTMAFGLFTAGFVLLLRFPEALVAAVHAVPFLGSFSFGGVSSLIALLVLMGLAFCKRLAQRPSRLLNLPIMLTLLFFAYLVLNWYLSGQINEEGSAGKLRLYFIRGVVPALVILTFDEGFNRFRVFLLSWVSFASLSSLMILASYLGLAKFIGAEWGDSGRIGLFGLDPISFSLPIGIAGIILGHYLLRVSRPLFKPFILALFCVIFFSLFPTGSRQTLLAMAFGLLVYVFVAYRKYFAKALAVAVVFFVLVVAFLNVASFYQSDRFDVLSTGYLKNKSFQGRLLTMEQGLNTFRGAPLFGVGLGGHGSTIYITNPLTGKVIKDKAHVHNLFIELLAEQGLFGFVFFLLPLIVSCSQLVRRLRERHADQQFRTHVGLLSALMAFGFLQANISGGISVSGAFMMILVAWASVLTKSSNDQPEPLLKHLPL